MIRLVRAPQAEHPAAGVRFDGQARRVLEHAGGRLRVLGGPGTGKTTLLAHCVAERIAERGVDPDQVLVLTASRRAAADVRERIIELLAGNGEERTVREPLVRTVHSYAFGLLRLQASVHELPPPRLLSGPEQDVVVRDLLAGDLEAGATYWPAWLRSALPVPAFAAELRDLLLRAAERGLGPEDLIKWGKAHRRPEWVAAGHFFRTYERVMLLRGAAGTAAPQATAPALDAAELVAAALLAVDTDPELLRQERDRVRYLFVDDAQHLDPQQAMLATRLGDAATEFVVTGDLDQTIFSFRGAEPTLLTDTAGDDVILTVDHRMAPTVRAAVSRLAARLPGTRRELRSPAESPETDADTASGDGTLAVQVFRSAAQEASWVADRLRRAHLLDGVPWSDMAVVVRSTARSLPVLRRALLAAGVPVAVPRDELPLARQPAVVPLLALLRCAVDPAALDAHIANTLLGSPLGGADPLVIRRLRRELRRAELADGGERDSDELLVAALHPDDGEALLGRVERRATEPATRISRLMRTVLDTAHQGAGAEEVLWQVWQATGLARRWAAATERAGAVGAQADRDLDAMVALFDAAARFADRLPGADGGTRGVLGFCDYVSDQQIPGDTLAARSPQGESVAVLTAHTAAGREWTVVAVPGVQEGTWPNLRLRGSLLGVERLVDISAGLDPRAEVSRTAPLLAEERRLLMVAASRARTSLLVSAVRGEDEQPSRFLDELDGSDTDPDAVNRPVQRAPRGLSLPELVGALRRAACDPATTEDVRERATGQLARLAATGVPGADPGSWYGLGPVSTAEPLREVTRIAAITPSTVEVVEACPLRWLLGRHGGEDGAAVPAVTGSLVHGLVQAAAAGATDEQLERALAEAWSAVDIRAPWFSAKERERVAAMLRRFREWYAASRQELTEIALEATIDATLPGEPPVRVRGRVDRLERDRDGNPLIIDVKTGKNPVTEQAAKAHPQLATYQVAASLGAFAEYDVSTTPGGARLLYLSKPGQRGNPAKELTQPALDETALQDWIDTLRHVATRTAGPAFQAEENADCARCPARVSCPLHASGWQVPQ